MSDLDRPDRLQNSTSLLGIAELGIHIRVLVGTRAIRFGRAIDALDLDVLLIVAAAIGLGGSMTAAGLTQLVAGGIEALALAGGRCWRWPRCPRWPWARCC